MTCIVGIVRDGHVYLGGDSAGSAGQSITIRADQKVFKLGPFVIGFSTSYRMGQLLRYNLELPKCTDKDGAPLRGDALMAYMVRDFVDAVREVLSEGGWKTTDKGVETGGNFLVGIHGRLFNIDSDFQVGEPFGDFDAVGGGTDIALGAMSVLQEDVTCLEMMFLALSAASTFNNTVSLPFNFVSTEADDG